MSNFKSFFYPERIPAVGTLVVANVTVIREEDAFVLCELPAYGNLEVLLTTSEIAVKRKSKLRDYVRVGQQLVVTVIRYIDEKMDVSLKQIHADEAKRVLEKFHRDAKVNLIVRTAAELDPLVTERLYREWVWNVDVEDQYARFEEIRANLEDSDEETLPPELIAVLRTKMPLVPQSVHADIQLLFLTSDGSARLSAELRRLAAMVTVIVVAAPKYRLVATDVTRARAQARLDAVTKPVLNSTTLS
jgi:translation initiation factor 2 alpha subunit (eIF-2alpha)